MHQTLTSCQSFYTNTSVRGSRELCTVLSSPHFTDGGGQVGDAGGQGQCAPRLGQKQAPGTRPSSDGLSEARAAFATGQGGTRRPPPPRCLKDPASRTAAPPLATSSTQLCLRCRARTGAPALPPPAAADTAGAQLTAWCSLDPSPHGGPGDVCGGRGQGPVGIMGPLCFLTNSTDPRDTRGSSTRWRVRRVSKGLPGRGPHEPRGTAGT